MPALSLFHPEDFSGDEITLPEIIDLYIAWLRLRVKAGTFDPEAFATVSKGLTRFGEQFPLPISACRQHDLTLWLHANPRWKSGSTQKREIAAILTCLKWAANPEEHADPLIRYVPYVMPKAVASVPYKARRPADHAEYVLLMRFGSRPLRRALFFLRRTGARTKEMRELIWGECFLDQSDPHIAREKNKTRRRTGKGRKIGLDAGTANFLRAIRRQELAVGRGRPGDLVFTNCDGNAWDRTTFGRHLRRHAARLGLDDRAVERVTAYCVRHTYACDGIEARVNDHRIADQMGLSGTAMIRKVYASHTRHKAAHLSDVADEMVRARKRTK